MNRSPMQRLFATALVLAAPAIALGAEAHAGESHGTDSPMFFSLFQYGMAILVFLIVFAVLSKAAWPKILGGLEAREKKIREEIFAAEESRKKASEMQAAHSKELAAAKAEAQRMIEQTRADAARTAADLRVKAEAEIAQMREQALASIEAAKKAAVQDIYNEAAGMATAAASKILERELNPADQARLIEHSLTEFRGAYAGR
ncbi:MAG: F0F1 ATP synthase subunit B [Planctomycetes bacterium]|nr:F0F1 ATP synthase subunit B [Planctomycetota bacterium]